MKPWEVFATIAYVIFEIFIGAPIRCLLDLFSK
jgi:hypothetical protein